MRFIRTALLHALILAIASQGLAELSAAQSVATPYAGGNGLSREAAVIITSAGDATGVHSEYAWIARHYPGSKSLGQALTKSDDQGRYFDRISIRTVAGEELDLWFDVTGMFK
jgi:hypothetical protein